jgi:hypothetical protein
VRNDPATTTSSYVKEGEGSEYKLKDPVKARVFELILVSSTVLLCSVLITSVIRITLNLAKKR